ncbi:hypothetical protein CR513_42196, partial [Mucuna pruriens]
MSPYWIVFDKACHLPLSSATWPMTKQGSKENSSCRNWTNSAWKLIRTLGSINRKVPSRPKSTLVQLTFKAHRSIVELKDERTNNTFQVNGHQIKLFHEGPTPITGDMETILLMESAPLHADSILILITSQSRKTMISLNLRGQRSFGIILGVGHVQVWGRHQGT